MTYCQEASFQIRRTSTLYSYLKEDGGHPLLFLAREDTENIGLESHRNMSVGDSSLLPAGLGIWTSQDPDGAKWTLTQKVFSSSGYEVDSRSLPSFTVPT